MMSKADELQKKMSKGAPAFTPRPSVTVRPLPENPTTPTLEQPTKPARKAAPKAAEKAPVVVEESDSKEPFSTSLKKGYKRNIKLYALGLGIKDREVVEKALDDFFAKHKKEAQL